MYPNFDLENNFKQQKNFENAIIAGIDEAGRGPLCGSVLAGCVVIINQKEYPKNVNDSKKLTEKKREEIFEEILQLEKNGKILFATGEANVNEIESLNIRNATKLAMQRAYLNLLEKYKIDKVDLVLVDGNFTPEINTNAEYVIKGDQKSISIATASIIAKVSRDKILKDMDLEFPEYNWKQNKGYGTKQHIEAIKKYGVCKYHRKSFIHI